MITHEKEIKQIIKHVYNFKLNIKRYENILSTIDENGNVIVKGVTGSGKTMIPIILFLNDFLEFYHNNKTFPRLVYAQPVKSLIMTKYKTIKELVNYINNEYNVNIKSDYMFALRTKHIHYDIPILSYDFLLSYMFAQFKMTRRSKQIIIPFGWKTFDEFHTFETNQIVKIIELMKYYPQTIFMSATIHPNIEQYLIESLNTKSEVLQPFRQRKVKAEIIHDNILNFIQENIDEIYKNKTLIIVNSVKVAFEITKLLGVNVYYARINGYYETDNNKKIALLTTGTSLKGRENIETNIDETEYDIIISTQIAEIGLNYNPNLVITDISPIDSLIQRIGRIRTKGKAYITIDDTILNNENDNYYVYNKELIIKTISTLNTYNINELLNNINTSSNAIQIVYGNIKKAIHKYISEIKNRLNPEEMFCNLDTLNNIISSIRDKKRIYLLKYDDLLQLDTTNITEDIVKKFLFEGSYKISKYRKEGFFEEKSYIINEIIEQISEDNYVYYTTVKELKSKNYNIEKIEKQKGNIWQILSTNGEPDIYIILEHKQEQIL